MAWATAQPRSHRHSTSPIESVSVSPQFMPGRRGDPPGDVTISYLIDWDEIENQERQHLPDTLAPWIERYPSVEVTCFVDPDKPSTALLRHAKDAQLIVVGSRGRGLLAGAVLGSTSLNLLHHSGVPVMICHSIRLKRTSQKRSAWIPPQPPRQLSSASTDRNMPSRRLSGQLTKRLVGMHRCGWCT